MRDVAIYLWKQTGVVTWYKPDSCHLPRDDAMGDILGERKLETPLPCEITGKDLVQDRDE